MSDDVALRAPDSASGETPLQRERARTIFEKGAAGRRAFACPELDVPEADPKALLPEEMRRSAAARLPEVSEPELVRHYVRLSKRNFDLDSGFYPLGSCTMKHNPRLHERVAALAGHARLHPRQHPSRAQGALELMWRLERALAEIAGLPHVSLQPSAGAHGELAGVLLTRAYHEDHGEARTKVLTPDTAHGTNPATVTMAGYELVKVATNSEGGIDLGDLRAKADGQVACLMLTNPNTLGIFDPNIEEICDVVRDAGATLYYDGANLNAIMGITRPGDMGFDIVHFNLHKSFTQPHGGGGEAAGDPAGAGGGGRVERVRSVARSPAPGAYRPNRASASLTRRERTSASDAPADAAFDFAHSQLKPVCVQSLTALAPSTALTTRASRGRVTRSATRPRALHVPTHRVHVNNSPTA